MYAFIKICLYKGIFSPTHYCDQKNQRSHPFSCMDSNHDLLNQNQACYHCTTGKFIVENPGNDPGSAIFQTAVYTMFANSPQVEIKGLEPLTGTV